MALRSPACGVKKVLQTDSPYKGCIWPARQMLFMGSRYAGNQPSAYLSLSKSSERQLTPSTYLERPAGMVLLRNALFTSTPHEGIWPPGECLYGESAWAIMSLRSVSNNASVNLCQSLMRWRTEAGNGPPHGIQKFNGIVSR